MSSGLKVTVKSCTGLLGVDRSGTSDPYVKLGPTGQKPQHTQTIKKELNPEWNESFHFSGPWTKEQLDVEVWDHNSIMADKCIGECKVNFADDDLVKEEFPSVGLPVEITRSLGEGRGTITLVLLPSFGSTEKLRRITIEKAKQDSESWPTHTLNIPDEAGRLTLRLPESMNAGAVYGKKYADFENSHSTVSEMVSFMATKSTETIKSREDLEKVMEKRISEASQRLGRAKFTGERGEKTIAGVEVMWASFFMDYSDQDPSSPFGNITMTYIFGAGGVEQQLIFMSGYQTRGHLTMEAALQHHHNRCDELWDHVINSMVIELA